MAKTRRNSGVRRRLVNDIASEIQTLPAFGFRAQPGISGLRTAQPTVPRDFAQFALPNGIADTDNHIANPYLYLTMTIMRLVRNSEYGGIGIFRRRNAIGDFASDSNQYGCLEAADVIGKRLEFSALSP